VTRAIRKHLGDFIAVIALFIMAVGIGGYILSQERLRFPFVEEEPSTVKVELSDAQAVIPGQGQTVRVAGVKVGDIGTVDLEDGKAVVELQIDPEYEGLIKEDATALLRTKTGLKDMFIEVDPGAGKPIPDGGRITSENTAPDTDPDEVLAALDTDTRDYLKLLIAGAGKGLKDRGSDLRETFKRFEPLHRDLARVTSAIARRRRNLRRLVHTYGVLTKELADNGNDVTRLVRASNSVLEAFASEDQNLSAAVAKLPGALDSTKTALTKVDPLARKLGPTLEALRPAFRNLASANEQVLPLAREGTPIVRDQLRPFARTSIPYFEDLGEAARDLAKAGPDLTTSFAKLNRLFNIGAYNPNGQEGLSDGCGNSPALVSVCSPADRNRQEGYLYWLGWTAQNTVSLFNTADAHGPFRRIYLGGLGCQIIKSEIPADLPQAVKDLVNTLIDQLGTAGVCQP
jgi:phospholipid/cholesterol/gamma-HCH transport system substrate-binding protein